MQAYSEIKHFVQQTLGCSCPEDVFNNIDYRNEDDGIAGKKITVGDRLLIYIISVDESSTIRGVIHSALQQGVGEREQKGLNRFRLVLASSRPNEVRSLAELAFNSSDFADEKTHLHVVNEGAVKNL